MLHIFVQVVKYLLILFILIYTFECFNVFRVSGNPEKQHRIYIKQRVMIYMIHTSSFAVLFFTTMNTQMIGMYILQILFITAVFVLYHIFYQNCSKLILNNMCILFSIGSIILTRLSYSKALRQYMFCLAGLVICVLIPIILQSISLFRNLTWLYAILGILALAAVTLFGGVSYGAKLSLSFGGISIQPSEFVKILFVFFVASMLRKEVTMKKLMITSAVSAIFVLLLVASKDLGGALLYFITFLVIVYAATGKIIYFLSGTALMAVAAFAGYHLFSHVQNRVAAWWNPLSVYNDAGYQVSQSLFGIGTGGWFGLGLNQGLPNKIPVVEKDFIFAAISEEMGGIFALCLILICLSCFLMFMNISMKLNDLFYKLVALGLATLYAMQVILTIGGVIKFIPSTGVTLPLVSYGGSSLLSTFIIFGIIQGLYMRDRDSEEEGNSNQNEEKKAKQKHHSKSKSKRKSKFEEANIKQL